MMETEDKNETQTNHKCCLATTKCIQQTLKPFVKMSFFDNISDVVTVEISKLSLSRK